ncbi:MAG: lipopolysaccharide biosynthesis protein [Dysgonamonadaceae bacterium]|jgi:O-antigen/teichoic acid export membrane protein|nr:lipopolysaccharide biosynthesis protein [Dysgonamonadaceae bacterium]
MTESTLKQKTANGLFWGSISNGAQQLISVVFGIYLARILNPSDYGLVGMLAIFTGIASTIVNSGFSVALTNKRDANPDDYNAVFWFTFWMGLFLYTILFFSAPLIARFYGRPELTDLSRVLFLSFFLGGISTVSYTILFKKLMVKQQALIEIISFLTACIIGLCLALKGFAFWALAIQSVSHVALSSLLRFIIVPWKPALTFRFSPLKQMFSFSFKLFLTQIFMQINAHFFSVILGKFYNAIQVGYYSQGQKWMAIGNSFVNGTITSVTQPVLVQMNKDKSRQINALRRLMRFGAFISFPLMLGLAFVGKEFIIVTIGDKWLPAVPFLQLFCIWGAAGFLGTLFTNLINTYGKSNIYMHVNIAIGLLQLITVVCMFSFGVFPMVTGYIVINFVGLLIWQHYVHQLIGLRLRDVLKDILPYLIVTIGCFFIAWLATKNIRNLYGLLIFKVVISATLYIVIMKLSNSIIFKESIGFLMNRIKK